MLDFEKLGVFYLGKRYDPGADALTDELVLYDSKDLTTHAVIIGMTGSGKTGLGIGLIEEAALDHVPVIAIDPKGDLGNLLLTFPDLRAGDFEPWVSASAAGEQGRSPGEFAAEQAALWKKGLGDWGQDGARIAALRAAAEFCVYTPGSTAGQPISVLKTFAAPDPALSADADLYRERVQATATSVLALLGIDADPVTSREHILVSQLLDHAWRAGRDLDIAGLIGQIQSPPMETVGVMAVDRFFPPKERFALAMQLNSLLAAPGFEAWMEGTPLSARSLLYTDAGKPRVSVVSIAHLDDRLRMFFVTMLLTELVAWMRAQPGTTSLRAILYMDEIFGYMPPVANPPSKQLLLTLLKQARAYGLGLVLATQNPVDLDYKGLSNTGTWFIGRLQTERDQARVMEGLEGAADANFDRQAMERQLAGLGKRRFLLHNVHEDAPVLFGTRWVMSYLAGPLTRDQIRSLAPSPGAAPALSTGPAAVPAAGAATPPASESVAGPGKPALPPDVPQCYVPAAPHAGELVYHPVLLGAAEIVYDSARQAVHETRSGTYVTAFADGPLDADWDACERLSLDAATLAGAGTDGARYAECPAAAGDAKAYAAREKAFRRWLRQNETLTLYKSKTLKLTSAAGETEADFRIRLQDAASVRRDDEVARLRERYGSRAKALEDRLLRARQALEREEEQVSRKRLDAVVSAGNAILGALLGRKKLSSTTAGRIGTAIRTAGSASKESADVGRAGETVARIEADLAELNAGLEKDIAALDTAYDAQSEKLEEVVVRAKATDIAVPVFGLGWLPYTPDGAGGFDAAW
ncbi:MAG TPA: DUF87 domain-containing protein [Woeseiaceae bacterium]|nr:DUF87 domain-containing protein [Woeseiaceae bacterium]